MRPLYNETFINDTKTGLVILVTMTIAAEQPDAAIREQMADWIDAYMIPKVLDDLDNILLTEAAARS